MTAHGGKLRLAAVSFLNARPITYGLERLHDDRVDLRFDIPSRCAEALARARAEDRPILLSIGYSACHWCHVMERESFENPEIAGLMNELFVNIKVDREERPDVDALYMAALHELGEHGGWPLTMFLTADGEPFWGGTYFPKTAAYGRASFSHVLREIARIHRDEGEKIRSNAEALRAALKQGRKSGAVVDK